VENTLKMVKQPDVKFNKTGYEIRTEVLGLAKELVEHEYNAKFAGWQVSSKIDEKTNEVVTTVDMPQFPGLDQVLETAQKMYDFVNGKK
jgi:hypothetical protein